MRIITVACTDNSAKRSDNILGCPVLMLMALLSPGGLNISVKNFLVTGAVEKGEVCFVHA